MSTLTPMRLEIESPIHSMRCTAKRSKRWRCSSEEKWNVTPMSETRNGESARS